MHMYVSECMCVNWYQTCNAGWGLEVWGSRQGHGGHCKGVNLSWGLHGRRVLCWRGEVNLIIKVVLKLLSQ